MYYVDDWLDRRKAEGRRQEAEGRNTIFALCYKGFKPLNLFMQSKKRCVLRREAREIQRPY
ncbi:hypothetical protein A4S05_08810 [Nostoc sp. KVJ20]|nr:hypothetical protein A4S05_08810 [Nostoc sp. KVJ20]